jgi:diaminopropionate ammonia-lyase
VAGWIALESLLAAPEDAARLGLGPDSRVLAFGTEGATDPELYARLTAA